jgi:hypothetical protein
MSFIAPCSPRCIKAFLLILWSGGISYVRHPFHPRHAKTAYPGAPVLAEWRVGFSFLVYTISKNALALASAPCWSKQKAGWLTLPSGFFTGESIFLRT